MSEKLERIMKKQTSPRRTRVRLDKKKAVLALVTLGGLVLWANVRLFFRLYQDNNNNPQQEQQYGQQLQIHHHHHHSVDDGMSACLLVMDDNHFLIEWLAYHYHTLPLRYLVIAVDPRSKTSPEPILRRWNDATNNLTIVVWNHDDDYVTADELVQAEEHVRRYFGAQLRPELVRHRARQRMFYYKCLQHMKQQQRQWTALIDTDEYLALNYEKIRQWHDAKNHNNNNKDRAEPRPPPPPRIEEPGSILKFLHQELYQNPDPFSNITLPCIQIPRIRFGAVESDRALVEQGVPKISNHINGTYYNNNTVWSGYNFATLRWRWHAHEQNYNLNRISKTILDVSRLAWSDLQPIDSIHRPIRQYCGHRKLHIRKSEQVLVLHHYLGTWEQYSFRDDARQGKERSQKVCTSGRRPREQSKPIQKPSLSHSLITSPPYIPIIMQQAYHAIQGIDTETDDALRPWLQGFVNSVGLDIAMALTKDAGKVQGDQ